MRALERGITEQKNEGICNFRTFGLNATGSNDI